MTREMIIKELVERGYKAEAKDVVKNGVQLEAICIQTDNGICPVIYTEEVIERAEAMGQNLDAVVNEIINLFNNNRDTEIDVKKLMDRDYVLGNIYIAMQRAGTEAITKRDSGFEGIESYLYIRLGTGSGEIGTAKVSSIILERAGVTEDEAWDAAYKNMCQETVIRPLGEILTEMIEDECEGECEEALNDVPMYVVSNKSRIKGASSILNKEVLAEFGRKKKTSKVVVLPSSIHEVLILPYTEEVDMEMLNCMVEDVNATQVDPTEQLADRAFLIAV